ncbi:MAG: class I SAM-dependent methyltransferase [Phycisphaerae bacterium]|nr:class I SAM-dependent methyltransferase [Phycisphaerae bacterium]
MDRLSRRVFSEAMLLFRRTIPTPEEVRQRYQTGPWAGNYIKFKANDNANYRYLFCYLDMVADLVVERSPRRVLDLGCGSGPILRRLRERLPKTELVGLDISMQLLKEALPNPAVRGDCLALPFKDAAFDIVVNVAVSELFSDADFIEILQEAKRVTRPGGCLVIQYRNPYSFWEPYWWFYRYPYYQNAYTRARLNRLARRLSLPIEHFQGTYLAAPPVVYRNHRTFYRGLMPEWLLGIIRRLDIEMLARAFPFLCRHFIVVHNVPNRRIPRQA